MVIVLTVISILLGIVEYFVIEIVSLIYNDNCNDNEKKIEDNCQTKKYFFVKLKNSISNQVYSRKQNKKNQLLLVIVISIFLTLLSFFEFTLGLQFYKAFFLNIILIIISFIDIRSQNIPNKAVMFTLLIGSLFILLGNLSFYDSICGMLVGGVIMWLISLIPGAIGGGDVKLMFALGLCLGFQGILNAMLISFFLASMVSLMLLLLKKLGRKDVIPFGPFLAVGTIIVINFMNK